MLCRMLDAHKLGVAELQQTWSEYRERRDLASRNTLTVHYTATLVGGVAHRVASHLPVEHDELISYGVFGLMDAIEKFDPEKGVLFETYAALRIKGAIYDAVRASDWAPRTLRAKARAMEAAEESLAYELGRQPTAIELAQHLDVTVANLHAIRSEVHSSSVASLDFDVMGEDGAPMSIGQRIADPSMNLVSDFETGEITDLLALAVNKLPTRSRVIVALYYLHGMTLQQIGEVLGVTESRVCQLQSRLLRNLQELMSGDSVAAVA